jgi:hypothetical protein
MMPGGKVIFFAAVVVIHTVGLALAQTFIPTAVIDQTSTAPLSSPTPASYQPRYVSGFGQANAFTVFFEDRDAGYGIAYNSTVSGPMGFSSGNTATTIFDTHFLIKDWPINVGGIDYAYRAWGAVGNNPNHHFYVSNDLTNWVLLSTFTISNAPDFTNAHGWVYYGFHDVILVNGTYYAFAESNQSQTMIVRSTNGDGVWEAFASVGGRPGDGPLELPSGVSSGWTPTGNFIDLGHDRGYGKIHADPRDSHFYLAINMAAKAGLPPATLEEAFIDPANWTWHDGTTGPASSPILSETGEHDLRECWVVPNTDPDADWVILYDADFGGADGGKALGYAILTPPVVPPSEVWVDDDYCNGCGNDGHTWGYDAFDNIQDGIDGVVNPGTVHVKEGTYSPGPAGIRIDSDSLVIYSTNGPASTILTLTTSCANEGGIEIDGNRNTLEGFTIRDYSDNSCEDKLVRINGDNNRITGNVLQGNLEQPGIYYQTTFGILDYGADTVIDSNEIYDVGLAGIHVGGPPHGEAGAVVSHNFIHNVMRRGIEIDRCPSALVTGNTITGITGGTIHGHPDYGSENVGIIVWGDSRGTVIVDQDLVGLPTGISLLATADVTVQHCDVSNMDTVGIRLEASYDYPYSQPPFVFDNHIILDCTLRDNRYGIVVGDGDSWGMGTGNRITNSDIIGNSQAGASNATTTLIDAKDNWWGSCTGPTHVSNPGGKGDAVSDHIDFDPWFCFFDPEVNERLLIVTVDTELSEGAGGGGMLKVADEDVIVDPGDVLLCEIEIENISDGAITDVGYSGSYDYTSLIIGSVATTR